MSDKKGQSETALTIAVLFCLIGGVAAGADEELPDLEFLEYLGMWEETDEDWLILDEAQAAEVDKRSDPAPEGEESAETTDEG